VEVGVRADVFVDGEAGVVVVVAVGVAVGVRAVVSAVAMSDATPDVVVPVPGG
jgi:hypothetical protein